MAPSNRPDPISPDVIDFKFSIVGEGFLEAANTLVNQMAELQNHLQQFGTSPEQAAAAARRATGKREAGFQHGSHQWTSTPGTPQPGQTTRGGPSIAGDTMPEPGTFAYDLWMARSGNRDWVGQQQGNSGLPSQPPARANESFGDALRRATREQGAGGPSTPPEPTRAQRLSRMGFLRRLGQYRDEGGMSPMGVLNNEIEVVEARESYQAQKRHGRDYQNHGMGTGYSQPDAGTGSGMGPSPGSSLPPANAHDPLWLRGLRADPSRYERAQETWQIPQFGEMTWQNKLDIGADWLQRSAVNSYHARLDRLVSGGMSRADAQAQLNTSGMYGQGVGGFRGYGSNLLRMGADNAVKGYLVGQMFRGAFDNGRGLSAAGTSLGYARGSSVTIPGTDIGFMLPGQGTMEGLRQRWTSTRLRMRSGISGAQANEIVQSLAQNGFSGSEGNQVGLDYISDLVRQGQDPEQATNLFAQAVRNGNTSMSEVAATLNDLGDSARTARQTLSQYMEGLDEFSERAQQSGALKGEGLQLARSVTSALGISGQQAAEVFDSPIMQATMMREQGILPNEIGNLGSSNEGRQAFSQGMLTSVETAMRMAEPFNRDQRDASGNIVISGKERQIAQAATYMGMSRETFERLLRSKDQTRNLVRAQGALENFQKSIGNSGGVRLVEGMTRPGDWIPATKGMPGAEEHAGVWMRRATVAGADGHYEISTDVQRNSNSWAQAEAALRAGAPTDSKRGGYLRQVEDISRMTDPKERIAAAQGLISRAQKAASAAPEDPERTVYVKFTGKAAQYFEQEQKREPAANRKANAGGNSRNMNAAGYTPDLPRPPGFGG